MLLLSFALIVWLGMETEEVAGLVSFIIYIYILSGQDVKIHRIKLEI